MEKINIKDARIASALKSGMPELYDDVFIMFHRNIDNCPILTKLHKWTAWQNNGEIADGVAIMEGGKALVVAPTGNSLRWSSAPVNGGGTTSTDRLAVLSDWNGRASTLIQASKAECSGENYAPGFCNTYSRVNANGQGITAGKWWQPSVGETMMIYSNLQRVNYALSLINGATLFSELPDIWTSTEHNTLNAWYLSLALGIPISGQKTTVKIGVRPVSVLSL